MIWCVDHDAQRRNLEIHALRCVGMDAKGYDSADSFWKDLQKECPELILMDAALPGIDPLALINRIRQSSVAGEIPVIMQAQSSNAQFLAGTSEFENWYVFLDDPRDTYRVMQGIEIYEEDN